MKVTNLQVFPSTQNVFAWDGIWAQATVEATTLKEAIRGYQVSAQVTVKIVHVKEGLVVGETIKEQRTCYARKFHGAIHTLYGFGKKRANIPIKYMSFDAVQGDLRLVPGDEVTITCGEKSTTRDVCQFTPPT